MALLNILEIVYYIVLPIVVVVLIIGVLIFIRISKRKKYFSERKKANNEVVLALGGEDNILDVKAVGSRLSVVLKDYSLINEEKLKLNGVSSIIRMSNKITLVIGQESSDIASLIKKN